MRLQFLQAVKAFQLSGKASDYTKAMAIAKAMKA